MKYFNIRRALQICVTLLCNLCIVYHMGDVLMRAIAIDVRMKLPGGDSCCDHRYR